MIADKACWERGCACHDTWDIGVEVVEKRQPLIEKEIEAVYEDVSGQSLRPQDYRIVLQFARAIEAKLKEKNT